LRHPDLFPTRGRSLDCGGAEHATLGIVTARRICALNRRSWSTASTRWPARQRPDGPVTLATHDDMAELAAGINALVAKFRAVVVKCAIPILQLLSTAAEIAATARQAGRHGAGPQHPSTAEVAASVAANLSAPVKELSGTPLRGQHRFRPCRPTLRNGRPSAHWAAIGRHHAASLRRIDASLSGQLKILNPRERPYSHHVVGTNASPRLADQTNCCRQRAIDPRRGRRVRNCPRLPGGAREFAAGRPTRRGRRLDIETMVLQMQTPSWPG